ncbi:hypothetical protein [Mycoplasmopsis gallopavonis]|uniref:Uncharacterized protein n=1 Tax=Mycoplasmopsis gallopavonis TaxID=76629 RepID=A0A449B031_9BACT|nr:hypothetical protein [Mycoplasmopsis gallopavonis]RIV16319.1 hypothetical protein D1113_02825 [Mycoplasmopsis gallopavonis]VEU73107.1 Uncharacterised protein [Mycoplasmopsis gallopavonis]
MNKLIKALNKKIISDRRKLKIYKILDTLISISIAAFNLSIIIVAIITLITLIRYKNRHSEIANQISQNSFWTLVALTSLIIIAFIITIVLAIYKYNSRQNEYKKIYNTLRYLQIKHDAGEINDEKLNEFVNKLWIKATTKTKLTVSKIIKDQITSGGK